MSSQQPSTCQHCDRPWYSEVRFCPYCGVEATIAPKKSESSSISAQSHSGLNRKQAETAPSDGIAKLKEEEAKVGKSWGTVSPQAYTVQMRSAPTERDVPPVSQKHIPEVPPSSSPADVSETPTTVESPEPRQEIGPVAKAITHNDSKDSSRKFAVIAVIGAICVGIVVFVSRHPVNRPADAFPVVAPVPGPSVQLRETQESERLIQLKSARPAIKERMRAALVRLQAQVSNFVKNSKGAGQIKKDLDQMILKKSGERDLITKARKTDETGLPSVQDFQGLAIHDMELAALRASAAKAQKMSQLFSDIGEENKRIKGLVADDRQLKAKADAERRELASICDNHPLKYRIPFTAEYKRVKQLEAKQNDYPQQAKDLAGKIASSRRTLERKKQEHKNIHDNFSAGIADVESVLERAYRSLKQ